MINKYYFAILGAMALPFPIYALCPSSSIADIASHGSEHDARVLMVKGRVKFNPHGMLLESLDNDPVYMVFEISDAASKLPLVNALRVSLHMKGIGYPSKKITGDFCGRIVMDGKKFVLVGIKQLSVEYTSTDEQ